MSVSKLRSDESPLERRRGSKRVPSDTSLYRCVICIDSPLELSAVRHAEHGGGGDSASPLHPPPLPHPRGSQARHIIVLIQFSFFGRAAGADVAHLFIVVRGRLADFLHGGGIDLWSGFGYADN